MDALAEPSLLGPLQKRGRRDQVGHETQPAHDTAEGFVHCDAERAEENRQSSEPLALDASAQTGSPGSAHTILSQARVHIP